MGPLGFDLGREYQPDVVESLSDRFVMIHCKILLLHCKIWSDKYKADHYKDYSYYFSHLWRCLLHTMKCG